MDKNVRSAGQTEILPDDIIFECPECGKSLAIDKRAAGMMVRCPECGVQIQVPGEPVEEEVAAEGEAEEAAEEATPPKTAVFDLETAPPEVLRAEIVRLARLRISDKQHLDRISAELGLIQAALDRLVEIIEEARGVD